MRVMPCSTNWYLQESWEYASAFGYLLSRLRSQVSVDKTVTVSAALTRSTETSNSLYLGQACNTQFVEHSISSLV